MINEPGRAEPGVWVQTSDGLTGTSPDGQWLGIYRPFTPWLHIYSLPTLKEVVTLTNHDSIAGFVFSPRSDELAVASFPSVELWNTETWSRTRELTNFLSLHYAPDERNWWLAKDFRTGGLYDRRTLQPLLPLPIGSLPLAISADGRSLAVSVEGRHLQVWDLVEVRSRLRELGLDWVD